MTWINSLLNKFNPRDDQPLTFSMKIERPSNFRDILQREKSQVESYLLELLRHYNGNDLENFRSSNSLVAHSQYANGLVVNKTADISEEAFMCVFEALKENTESLDYRLNYQSCEVKVGENSEERKEVYYLKPVFDYSEGTQYRQRFGNVKLERTLLNGKSKSITLLCTYYSGHNYSDPYPFEDLLASLCR